MLKTSIPGLEENLLRALARAELDKLGPASDPAPVQASALAPRPDPETSPVSAAATPPSQRHPGNPVALDDLLALHGQEFLDRSWMVLTGTRPDPERLAPHLEAMRSGELNKVEILDAFRKSPEGRAAAVPLPGLGRRLLPFRIARLPLLGELLRWGAALYRLPENWQRMNILWAQRDAPQAGDHASLEIRLLRRELDAARQRIRDLETRPIAATPSPHGLDELYLAFENTFRGPREEIKQRLRVYLPYVRQISAGTANAPILDIGCGRGEWLELLRDEGLQAEGVDLNRASVAMCRELGLQAIVADALERLQALPAQSLGAITAFHLIEHLPLEAIVTLLDAAHRVLVPGGALILETPNTENLLVAACSFHRDPTHLRPIHPETAFFLLSQRGYRWIYWTGLNPFTTPDAATVPEGFVHRLLFAPQDFMIIGHKLDTSQFPVHGKPPPPEPIITA